MSYSPSSDFMLEIASGRKSGYSAVNKFGHTENADSSVDTDLWDAPAQPVWLAPTAARTHLIASTSANDASGGTGARTIEVRGLTSWSASEVSETVTLSGLTTVTTTNSFVILHRMQVLTHGASFANEGIISATATTDGTVTARISAGEGQTQMAIYGVPSNKTAYMVQKYNNIIKGGVGAQVTIKLLVNPTPDTTPNVGYLTKHRLALDVDGTSAFQHDYVPYNKIAGPAIIKMQANSTANDTVVAGGFDMILEDN